MKKIIPNLLALIFLSSVASGQQTQDRTCRILFLDRAPDSPRTLHLFDGTASREVDLPGMNLSTPFSPPSGLATGSFNGLHTKSKFLAADHAREFAEAFVDLFLSDFR